jgi:hypothetical protein
MQENTLFPPPPMESQSPDLDALKRKMYSTDEPLDVDGIIQIMDTYIDSRRDIYAAAWISMSACLCDFLTDQTFDSEHAQVNRSAIVTLYVKALTYRVQIGNRYQILWEPNAEQVLNLLHPRARHFRRRLPYSIEGEWTFANSTDWLRRVKPTDNAAYVWYALHTFLRILGMYRSTPRHLLLDYAEALNRITDHAQFADPAAVFPALGLPPLDVLATFQRTDPHRTCEDVDFIAETTTFSQYNHNSSSYATPNTRQFTQSIKFVVLENRIHDWIDRLLVYFCRGLQCTGPVLHALAAHFDAYFPPTIPDGRYTCFTN